MRVSSLLLVTTALVLCLLHVIVLAECPNGCSGTGDCMNKDMCVCYKNYQGNDCADYTCPSGYAHADTPKGDINMDQTRMTGDWILTNSQQSPAGTYEYFPPNAHDDEAHFYMECSNKGLCDRGTGICACFDGYEGSACQRTTCPNKCNGHGTCESIRELGAKGGGTLFGRKEAAGAVTYDLWDGNVTYGCRCDPWFKGADCSRRACKVGIDPLFLAAGTATYETFFIHAYVLATYTGTVAGKVRLRLFDYHGESYITPEITIADDTGSSGATNGPSVVTAITAIPNQTFRKVRCEDVGIGPNLGDFKSTRSTGTPGMSVVCQYIDNPGRIRLPEVVSASFTDTGTAIPAADVTAFVTTSTQQGHDDEWFTTQTKIVLDSITLSTEDLTWDLVSGPSASDNPVDVIPPLGLTPTPVPQLLKVGPHIVLATSASPTTITLAFPLMNTLGSADKVVFMAGSYDPSSNMAFTITALDTVTTATPVGATTLTFTAAPSPALVPGDLIFYYNQFFYIQEIDTAGTTITFDRPFGGSSVDGGDGATGLGPSPAIDMVPYKIEKPVDKTKMYNYVSECSGRGICGLDTGICTCFKGYTNDNCNTQNILAL